jgi:arginine-tRNA-protein transferase
MKEWFRLIEPPRRCAYLVAETASLELRFVAELSAAEYADLLARGYRRFGHQVFRPACPACRACRPLRVLADRFEPGPSGQRVLRQNAGIEVELGRPGATAEQVALYNLYHRFMRTHRGWPGEQATPASYREGFLAPFDFAREWRYREGGRLVGVALMDEVPGAISLVYCYYHPAWRPRSPGTFSILQQLLYARERGHRYAYLGYWIPTCQSMSYKARFRPHELLREFPAEEQRPVWEQAD